VDTARDQRAGDLAKIHDRHSLIKAGHQGIVGERPQHATVVPGAQ
jgi:hypothetical protein